MQPLAIKYCGHFNMKYPMGKCVWGGLLQQLEKIGEFSFVGNINGWCFKSMNAKVWIQTYKIVGAACCVCRCQNYFTFSHVTFQELPFQQYHKVHPYFPGCHFTFHISLLFSWPCDYTKVGSFSINGTSSHFEYTDGFCIVVVFSSISSTSDMQQLEKN